jgi:7-keto-8-aminopelargonate synthetase-like enzyme
MNKRFEDLLQMLQEHQTNMRLLEQANHIFGLAKEMQSVPSEFSDIKLQVCEFMLSAPDAPKLTARQLLNRLTKIAQFKNHIDVNPVTKRIRVCTVEGPVDETVWQDLTFNTEMKDKLFDKLKAEGLHVEA